MYNENLFKEARQAEKNGEWRKAENLWKSNGSDYAIENANACKLIADSIEKGDKFRELISGVYERWEKHEINNKELNDILADANEKVYGIQKKFNF